MQKSKKSWLNIFVNTLSRFIAWVFFDVLVIPVISIRAYVVRVYACKARSLTALVATTVLILIFAVTALLVPAVRVAAAPGSSEVNFQARLEMASGALAPDGNYNVEFKLYQGGTAMSGGTLVWTEDHLNSTTTGVNVYGGYLSAELGSVESFSGHDIDWSQDLYLTMNIGGTNNVALGSVVWDGEMSPRIHLTSVPFAFEAQNAINAESAAGLSITSGGNASGLTFATPTHDNTIMLPDASGTVCLSGAGNNCSFDSMSLIDGLTLESVGGTDTIDTDSGGTLAIGGSSGEIDLGNTSGTTVMNFAAGSNGLQLNNDSLSFNNGADRALGITQAASGNGNDMTIQAGAGAGTGATNGGNLLLQGGTANSTGIGGSVIVKAADTLNTAMFQIQNSGGTMLFGADTSTNFRINIGSPSEVVFTPTGLGDLNVAGAVGVLGELAIGSGGNTAIFAAGTGLLTLSGTARHPITVTLTPSYPGAIASPDGSDNTGTLTKSFCANLTGLSINASGNCDSGQQHTYYAWTTSEATAQDDDIYTQYQLPSDFSEFNTTPISMYGWSTSSSDHVQISIFKNNGDGTATACVNNTDIATATAAWTKTDVTSLGSCTFNAGDVLTIKVHLQTNTGDYAKAGEIVINYLDKF